jgi:hypothetical protein
MFNIWSSVHTLYIRPQSLRAQCSKLCPTNSSSGCHGSLDTWTVIHVTTAKLSLLSNFDLKAYIEVEVMLWPTVIQQVCSGVWSQWPNFFFLFDNCRFLAVWCPLWQEYGSVIYSYIYFWALPEQSLWGPSPVELGVQHLRPPTWRPRSPYSYSPGTGWPSFIGKGCCGCNHK